MMLRLGQGHTIGCQLSNASGMVEAPGRIASTVATSFAHGKGPSVPNGIDAPPSSAFGRRPNGCGVGPRSAYFEFAQGPESCELSRIVAAEKFAPWDAK